ncbi:MAG: hypothetical protein ABI051_07825 [Vicinamibacterales bacterium]
MNVLLWVLQIALALLYLSGGAYKAFMFDELARGMDALSRGGWAAVGVFEMLGGVLLVLPAVVKSMRGVTPIVAGALALETFALVALYASYSLEWSVTNPLVWAVVMGLLIAFVAYGRRAQAAGRAPHRHVVGPRN